MLFSIIGVYIEWFNSCKTSIRAQWTFHSYRLTSLGFFAHLCDEEIHCVTFIFNDILQTDLKNLAQIQTLILYNIQFLPKP